MAVTLQALCTIPSGKSLGHRDTDTYYFVALRPEGLVVECGWTVPETYDDDPSSYNYNPFRNREETPAWVGRRQGCQTPEEALAVFQDYKMAVQTKCLPHGAHIGSVVR